MPSDPSAQPDRTLRWRMLLGAAALLALLSAALIWAFRPAAVEVETARVVKGPYEETLEEEARTRVRERVGITLPWNAAVERIGQVEGRAVEVGEVVAWVHPSPTPLLDERAQREAQARVAAARQSLERARHQQELSQVAWQRATVAAARAIALAQMGFIADAQVDAAGLDLRAAERAWETSRDSAREAEHALELAEAAPAVQALQGRSRPAPAVAPLPPVATHLASGTRLPLRTPVQGRILRVLQPHAAVLAAGTVIMEIGDVERPEVLVQALTSDAQRLKPGMSVRLDPASATAPQASVAGVVRQIEPHAITKVSALGLEEQRVNVLIDPEPGLPQGDGYSLRARFILQQQDGVLTVPRSAVFPWPSAVPLPQGWHREPGLAQDVAPEMGVYVVEGDRVRLRPVALAGQGPRVAWVQGGLKEGDTVVVYPPAGLAPDGRVREVRR